MFKLGKKGIFEYNPNAKLGDVTMLHETAQKWGTKAKECKWFMADKCGLAKCHNK